MLTFAQATDFPGGDEATVNIIDDATGEPILEGPFPLTITDDPAQVNADWASAGPFALPVGRKIRIEWCFTGTGGVDADYMGWYIDDVEVTIP